MKLQSSRKIIFLIQQEDFIPRCLEKLKRDAESAGRVPIIEYNIEIICTYRKLYPNRWLKRYVLPNRFSQSWDLVIKYRPRQGKNVGRAQICNVTIEQTW